MVKILIRTIVTKSHNLTTTNDVNIVTSGGLNIVIHMLIEV